MIPKKYLYHITPKKNIPDMKIQGIIPKPDKPAPFCDKEICLFDDRTTMEDALMNWLSDKFPENEPLVCLTINPTGLDIHSSDVGYEVITDQVIPWKNVVKVEDV
jgi:hypothetical protein